MISQELADALLVGRLERDWGLLRKLMPGNLPERLHRGEHMPPLPGPFAIHLQLAEGAIAQHPAEGVQGLLQDLLAVSDEQQPRPCPHPGRWRVDGRAGPDRRAMRSRARTRPLPSRRRNWPGTCEAWRASPAPPGARSTPAHRAGQPQKYSRSRCRRCWIHCGDLNSQALAWSRVRPVSALSRTWAPRSARQSRARLSDDNLVERLST